MKTLYIMRHAQKDESQNYTQDYDVELTKHGFEEAQAVALKLKEKNIKPDLIVSSPAIRAKQTAQVISEILEYDKSIMYNEVIYQAYLNEILESITYTFDTVDTLLIIGHNPSLSALSISFGGEKVQLKTANIVKIEFDCNSWTTIDETNARYIKTIKP